MCICLKDQQLLGPSQPKSMLRLPLECTIVRNAWDQHGLIVMEAWWRIVGWCNNAKAFHKDEPSHLSTLLYQRWNRALASGSGCSVHRLITLSDDYQQTNTRTPLTAFSSTFFMYRSQLCALRPYDAGPYPFLARQKGRSLQRRIHKAEVKLYNDSPTSSLVPAKSSTVAI